MTAAVLAVELARVVLHGVKRFVVDARRYGEMSFDERHLLYKRAQSAAFVVLMPVFLLLGAAAGLLERARSR